MLRNKKLKLQWLGKKAAALQIILFYDSSLPPATYLPPGTLHTLRSKWAEAVVKSDDPCMGRTATLFAFFFFSARFTLVWTGYWCTWR